MRYDITTSLSEWPNFRNTYQAIQKFSNLNKRLEASGVNWSVVAKSTDDLDFIEEADEFRRNFLRVHVYISEMNFMLVMDQESYAVGLLRPTSDCSSRSTMRFYKTFCNCPNRFFRDVSHLSFSLLQ